jgi:hypothetical protein
MFLFAHEAREYCLSMVNITQLLVQKDHEYRACLGPASFLQFVPLSDLSAGRGLDFLPVMQVRDRRDIHDLFVLIIGLYLPLTNNIPSPHEQTKTLNTLFIKLM